MSKKIKAAVLRVAGINCDKETVHALELTGAEPSLLAVNTLVKNKDILDPYSLVVIPGGFSYGDDIGAGKIFANELKYKLKAELERYIGQGRLVIGICNGFQVLIKSGFLPGFSLSDERQVATLTFNNSGRFDDRWIYLKTNLYSCCVFVENLPERFYLPIAHGEGKFMVDGKKTLDKIISNKQVVFQYIKENGQFGSYPWNPNGSVGHIAAICNAKGNVMGMMPHPERFWSFYNHPRWTRMDKTGGSEGQGLSFFRAAIAYASKKLKNG